MYKLVSLMFLCCLLRADYAFAQTEDKNKAYQNSAKSTTSSQCESMDSISGSINLNEIEVKGKRSLTKFTSTGLIYDLHSEPAVVTMSVLEALRHVPMVTVTANDEIRVKGSSSYAIYLNGRPYRVAQTDPKTVLNSIPATSISKVELITELDGRYDAEAGSAIINLITVKNAIDSYTLTFNGRTNTKLEHERVFDGANAGVSFVATKGRVNFMGGYEYSWQNVLNQPMSSEFTFFNPQGKEIRSSTTTLNSVDGNYNFHTPRLMLEWIPDTLNSVYVDAHAFFDHHYNNAVSTMTDRLVGSELYTNYYRSYQSNTSGTAETNVIYRNYYPDRGNLCRFSFGYRFALDPEKAKSDFTVSEDPGCMEGDRTLCYVNGHLHEHTINVDYSLPLTDGHLLHFGAKDIIRLGKTRPEYRSLSENESLNSSQNSVKKNTCCYFQDPCRAKANIYEDNNEGYYNAPYAGEMNYTQNISALYGAYNGRVGKFNLAASLRMEYSHNSFNLLSQNLRYNYNYFDLIPRLSVFYSPSSMCRYSLTYNTLVTRPGINQLDPFRNILYHNYHHQGNPDLRQSRTHSLNLAWLKMSQKLVMQITASANHCVNPIVEYYTCEPQRGEVTMTLINFSRRNFLNQSLYIGYRPNNWLSLTLAPSITENCFSDQNLDKKCFGVDWNLYFGVDASLTNGWSIGGYLMCNRQFTEPYNLHNYTAVIPVLYANKCFMEGKLTVGVTIDSPLSKYIHHKSETSTSQFTHIQYNDILQRGIAIKATYRLSSGKSTNLQRDTTLRNEDLSTGVK